MKTSIKSIAVIGCGPAGAVTIDALGQEGCFDVIKVFERREKVGGCWIPDPPGVSHQLPINALANSRADQPLSIPSNLPTWTPKCTQYRFSDTSIYPALETNIVAEAMEFSQEPIPKIKSEISIQRHGLDTPFRPHSVIQQYLEDLVNRNGYENLVQLNTTVERIEKDRTWRLILRREELDQDYWWEEEFDAVLVASGHYTVPFIPHIPGLAEFAETFPGTVEHSKSFRNPESYRGKRVVTVGASISGPDTAAALAGITETPLHSVVRGKYHPYFGDWAFRNPYIKRHPPISHISTENRTIFFEDGTKLSEIDHIILGTGYSWTLHFLPEMEIRNNRVPGLYMHVFNQQDPTLAFVGAVAAGFTFKVFEWQAVLASRFLAGKISLPSVEEQIKWERNRVKSKGDGVPFTAFYPDFEEYFEEVRKLAGNADSSRGRRLPRFEQCWKDSFDAGHLKRIDVWKELNRQAEEELKLKNGEKMKEEQKSEASIQAHL